MQPWMLGLMGGRREIQLIGQSFTHTPSTVSGVIVDKPSGVIAGDLLVAICIVGQASPTSLQSWTPPTGWEERFDTFSRSLSTRRAGDSEPASYAFASSISARLSCLLLAYRNAEFDQYNSSTLSDNTNNSQNLSVPSGSFVFANFSNNGQSSGSFSVNTSGWIAIQSDSSGPPISIDVVKESASGDSGVVNVTSNQNLRSFTWSLKPA